MGYGLGIDVGTTFTAAALFRDGNVEVFALATYQNAVPSVIFADGDDLLYAGAAERRGAGQPLGLAREFKRRLGDPVPLMLSGSPFHADRLTALMAKWVVDSVTEQVGEAPERIVMTHPANWTEYQLGTLRNALADVGLEDTELISEPAAATLDYAAAANLEPDSSVLVYDLGGGTFDVALLRRVGDTFEHQIEPAGIERLGGIDFDEAVFQYVCAEIPADVLAAARQNPEGAAAIGQLRRRCVDAKEALSSDAASDVPVMLPGYTATVRITRPEFEAMIRPMVHQTIDLVEGTLARAEIDASSLGAVLLVGGSSRIPLVPQLVSEQLRLPVRVDAHPKLVVARGAARQTGIEPAEEAKPSRWVRAPRQPEPDGLGDEEDRGRRVVRLAVIAALVLAAAAAGYWFFLRDDEGGSAAPATTTIPETATTTAGSAATVPQTTTAQSASVTTAVDDGVAPGQALWEVPTGGPIGSVRGPSTDDETVVFASQDGLVYRAAKDDGSLLWSVPIAPTVFSSPLISGDAVFVGSNDGVHALALADGSLRWSTGTGVSFQSSPWVDGDTVYIGSDDTNLYALDAATGAVRWQTPLGAAVFSSPIVVDGVVYVGSLDNSIYALDATTGEIRWRTPTGGPIYASPAVEGGRVFVGSNDRRLYALNAATGVIDWSFVTSDWISSSAAVSDGVVYVGSFDDNVYAVDAELGGERWRFDTGNDVFSSPKVDSETVYVGSHSNRLFALSAEEGSTQWTFRAGAIVGATPTVDDDRVYVGADDGNVYAIQR